MEDTRETIRNIKKELRLFMNGVTSAQQRKLGMNYNIIFGVDNKDFESAIRVLYNSFAK